MKKAFDQTVRDLKRGVNKKVLKVPSIEQKVLDATSNEPWGPHGSLLADIAQATRNYHEYQIIMSVIWKRVNDTRKNWRHVYKALTVLEYLVAHGSERVIDDIREHANQISTLSDFQYINSSGKDQGNNVRKKSQSLVVLVNDKERIQEVRQKAATTRDNYRNNPVGSMYRPGSGGYGDRYDDDCYERRYGNRDDDSNGYGRDRDWGSHDDERYGQYGDSYGREGERDGRDYEERYTRDGYRDDDYRGRSRNIDDYNYSSRSRSADQDRNLRNEDEGQYSSRGSGAIADDNSQDGSTTGKRLDHKYSGQHLVASHSYEDGAGAARSPSYSDWDGESSLPNVPKESLVLHASSGHITATAPAPASPPTSSSAPTPAPTSVSTPASVHPPASSQTAVQHSYKEVDGFDDFDPRGSSSVVPPISDTVPATTGVEMDLLGSLSESFSPNSLALMPASQPAMTSEANGSASVNLGATFAAALPADMVNNQPFDDPFGDGPFKAGPSTDTASSQPHIAAHSNSFNVNSSQRVDVHQSAPVNAMTELGGTFHDANLPSDSAAQPPTTTQFPKQEPPMPSQEVDILADILPPPATSSSVNAQAGYPALPSESVSHNGFPQTNQPEFQSGLSSPTIHNVPQNSYQAQTGLHASFTTQLDQPSPQTSYPLQPVENVLQTDFTTHAMPSNYPVQAVQASQLGFHSQSGTMQPNLPNPNFYGTYNTQSVSTGPTAAYIVPPSSTGPATHQNFLTESSSAVPTASQMGPQPPLVQSSSLVAPVSTNPSSTGPAIAPQSSKDKFETKSTIWADTLSRGLVDLNISGPKANPLADIGVDFDAINRKEKRMEKPTTAPVTSTVTMGKAMGSGSGMSRTVANALRPPPNPVMASGMNNGMAGGPGTGIGMGGYGVSQPLGRGTGMNMPGNMGMEMNMAVGHGVNMPQQMGFPPGYTMPGGYNHMTGTGYGQQPHGYR